MLIKQERERNHPEYLLGMALEQNSTLSVILELGGKRQVVVLSGLRD